MSRVKRAYALLTGSLALQHVAYVDRLRVKSLRSNSFPQVVTMRKTKYSMCEIWRTVKTNRETHPEGGKGWERHTLLYKHTHTHMPVLFIHIHMCAGRHPHTDKQADSRDA